MGTMKTTSLDREIRSRIESLVTELTNSIRGAALEAVHDALGGKKMSAGAAVSAPRAAPAGKRTRRGRPGTRSPEQVMKAAGQLLAYIKTHQGARLDQIAKGMGTTTKDLKLPAQKLFASKNIKTTGIQRGTKYFLK
jgi:hypothetical protein